MSKKNLCFILIIFHLFSFSLNADDNVFLQITRSKSHFDQTNSLTPLIVTLSSEDKGVKVKGVDLICVVDVSGSMSEQNRLPLVKESLKYLVNIMNKQDRLALITFNSESSQLFGFTEMIDENKSDLIKKINSLTARGGTNIYAGLKAALKLITIDYLTGDKVASIILLSDGESKKNTDELFKEHINSEKKSNFAFNLHSLGFGDDHDADLMHRISLIRDGGYFFIRYLSMVNDAILEIYGSLSTTYKTNVVVTITSNYRISDVKGRDDMYQNYLKSQIPSNFTTQIIHFVYGKRYDFITLVDIPSNINKGEVVLTATISPFNKVAHYLWDNALNPYAYEEYIRGISFTYFQDAYKEGLSAISKGISVMNTAYNWISVNYDGMRDWKTEYNDIITDLNNFKTYGKANILSKLRELKSSKLGLHYNDENSYQRKIIDGSYDINTDDWIEKEINEETKNSTDSNKNYISFYLMEGKGEINGIHFSGQSSSIIFVSDTSLELNIKPLTDTLKYKYKDEQMTRIQTKVDLSSGSKFYFKKDFPFEFYTQVDGTKDITFNIQFLNFEYTQETSSTPEHIFEINGYILDSSQIQYLKSNINYQPNTYCFKGYYDQGHQIGKLIILKEQIKSYLSLSYVSNLYIIISKAASNNNIYTLVEGQYSFVSMDYTFNFIPESFYIFSSLSQGQKNPHLFAIKMEPQFNKTMRIEFATSGNELDCKVLQYKTNFINTDEYYEDFKDFKIERSQSLGKTYIDITQGNNETNNFESIILSIFSKNGGHIAGNEINKLSYVIRYTTDSDYGIYTYNDLNITEGKIEIIKDISDYEANIRNISISYFPLAYKKDNEDFTQENTRFYIKLFPITKRAQKIYESISLFEFMTPTLFIENENYDNQIDFQVDPEKNYFLTTYTVSNVTNEILSYKSIKIRRNKTDLNITDTIDYENEYDNGMEIDIDVDKNISKKYFLIKISGFKEGEYGTIYAKVDEFEFKSVEPSNNIILIPSNIVKGKKVNIQVKLKDHKNTEYYLEVKLIDQLELTVGENFFFEMEECFNETLEVVINNRDESKNKMNIFIQSSTGNFEINGLNLQSSDIFGAKSINTLENSVYLEINAKTGEYISIYTHVIDDTDKRKISNYEINLFGYLEEKDCIYFDEEIKDTFKYQVRILSDKVISIKYNSDTNFEFTEPGVLYLKEFNQNLKKICLKQKNDLDSIFFNMQIINVDNEKTTKAILEKAILGNLYKDKLLKDEIRYYRQGLFVSNPSSELMYRYHFRQIEGEMQVYVIDCDDFPYVELSKKDIENNEKVIKLYNIDEYFTYSKRAKDLVNYNPQKTLLFIILCMSDNCEFNFIINTSNSIVNLSKLDKFSTKIYKNNIDKYSITKKDTDTEMLSISLYTHSGEIVLSTNDKCEGIKHLIFGNLDRMEIPKICGLKHEFEIYVQANMDSVYSIEFNELNSYNYSKIKSNIVHIESIIDNKKILEFTPMKKDYFIKFIPINCEIEIKYKINGEYKKVSNYQNIFVYDSAQETEKINMFEISSKDNDCMIYTYLEELKNNFYSIISDQVPFYLSLEKTNSIYTLIYPIPNSEYLPYFKINLFEETPLAISQSISNDKGEKIEVLFSKDIKAGANILKKCDKDNICYLIINIETEKKLDNNILIEVIPKSSNIIPGVLLDNKLKQDFVKMNKEEIYMTKILKNEEGEVYFNYKYFSGELIGKLINIEKTSWKNRYDLPKVKEYLTYDNLRQKIIFTKKETEKCDNDCYSFVEVHPYEKLLDEKNNDLNMDYSIYLKKSDNIIQLRLNEVIIGTLSKTIEDNYIEYYSIEIPYSTKKIFIDYSSENTNVIINSGEIKPTKDKSELNFISTGKDQIYTIEKNSEDLKGKKYIIGIYTNKLNNGVSQYSFRIRVENEIIPNYIISDISTENICETKSINQFCYFLIPVISVQKNSNLFLYGISTSNSDDLVISYKKIKMNDDVVESDKYIDDDVYTKTSKDQFIKNMLYISNTEMNLKEDENILIKIEVPEPGIVTLLHTFKSNLLESLLNPKNKEVFYMNSNSELYLNIPQGVKSLVHVNVISGKGFLGYENDEQSTQEISGKYSSMYLQSTENNVNRIKIKTEKDSNFIFYSYIKIGAIKRNINEISLGSAVLRTEEGFPIEFYSKVSQNQDYIINFNIDNINLNNNEIQGQNYDMSIFNIKAYIVPEDIIEKIKLDDTYVYNKNPIKGKFEIGFSMAKLVLNKDLINEYYTPDKKNYIYLIIEDSYNNPTILNNVLGEITIWQNNNIDYIAPNNIYINSNLELNKDYTSNKYKLIKKNSDDKIMRIEFSASSNDIKYKLYYNNTSTNNFLKSSEVNYTEEETFGKKNIDINLEEDFNTIIFEIYNDKKENDINKLSYSLRYRTDKANNFINYIKNDSVKIIETKKENNMKKVSLAIPPLKNNATSEIISAEYYLKIYKYSENDLSIKNTISIIDNLEPYQIIELIINSGNYNQTIEIPDDNNNYYITINAITKDRELLSYNSLCIEAEKKEEEKEKEGEKEPEKNEFPIWAIIVIIIAAVIILLVIGFFIYRYYKKQHQDNIEESTQNLISTE